MKIYFVFFFLNFLPLACLPLLGKAEVSNPSSDSQEESAYFFPCPGSRDLCAWTGPRLGETGFHALTELPFPTFHIEDVQILKREAAIFLTLSQAWLWNGEEFSRLSIDNIGWISSPAHDAVYVASCKRKDSGEISSCRISSLNIQSLEIDSSWSLGKNYPHWVNTSKEGVVFLTVKNGSYRVYELPHGNDARLNIEWEGSVALAD